MCNKKFRFYQPVLRYNLSICGGADVECTSMVMDRILLRDPLFKCECHSGCYQLNYDAKLSWANIYHGVPLLRKKGLDPKDVAILHTYFRFFIYLIVISIFIEFFFLLI